MHASEDDQPRRRTHRLAAVLPPSAIQKSASNPRAWCCSFAGVQASPDFRSVSPRHSPAKPLPASGSSLISSPSSKSSHAIIDPRRILSPGRVSPIDSDCTLTSDSALPVPDPTPAKSDFSAERQPQAPTPHPAPEIALSPQPSLDLRLILKGKDGKLVAMELDSKVVCEGSYVFARMLLESRQKVAAEEERIVIEVTDVEDIAAFMAAIELMHQKDLLRRLVKGGVSQAIQILEVFSSIMFERGVECCLKYIEAVPWSKAEEEKLKNLFAKGCFVEEMGRDVLARLSPSCALNSNDLVVKLIQSITNSNNNNNAKKELQALVNGLISKSSVYEKEDLAGLKMEELYKISHFCLKSLVDLFKEASSSSTEAEKPLAKLAEKKPMVERVSNQVENISWLFEIMLEKQMAEDFVGLWAVQTELVEMHRSSSPMVRYELSRISAFVFIALGNGRVRCRSNVRSGVVSSWFPALLADFGWLRRCPKGVDTRVLEDGLGQAILTLPILLQRDIFLQWLKCFSAHRDGCPNLSKAFRVWFRRSFRRSSETRCRNISDHHPVSQTPP